MRGSQVLGMPPAGQAMMRLPRVPRGCWLMSLGMGLCVNGALAVQGEAERLGGELEHITANALYLDSGRLAGLSEGANIDIVRDRRIIASLRVDQLADHYASVLIPSGTAVVATDVWRLSDPVEADASNDLPVGGDGSTLRDTDQEIDPTDLAAKWAAASVRPWRKAQYEGSRAAEDASPSSTRAFLRATSAVQSWSSSTATTNQRIGPGAQIRFDSAAWKNLRFELETDAIVWASEPKGERVEPTGSAFLLLRRLSAVYTAGSLVARLGRSRPLAAPGARLQDGVVLTWRPLGAGKRVDRGVNVGVYGGAVPESGDLQPTGAREVLGAYARLRRIKSVGRPWTFAARAERRSELESTVYESEAQATIRSSPNTEIGTGGVVRHSGEGWVLPTFWLRGHIVGTSGSAWASWRRSRILPNISSNLPPEFLSVETRTQAESGIRIPVMASFDLNATFGQASGSTGFDRWSGRLALSRFLNWWRFSGWSLSYQGALGWYEGHEGGVGLRLLAAGLDIDLRGGGGVLHQTRTGRIAPVAYATLGLSGPLSSSFVLDCELQLRKSADYEGVRAWIGIAYGM